MKISTLLLLAILGFIGYGFVHEGLIPLPHLSVSYPAAPQGVPAAGGPAGSSAVPSAAPDAPQQPRRTEWTEQETTVARGVIKDRLDNGSLVMQCSDANQEATLRYQVYNGGARVAQTMHNIALSDEAKVYGPLLTVRDGRVTSVPGEPARFVVGTVLVRDFPPGDLVPGKRMRVIVAPLGAAKINGQWMETFTAVFTTTGPKAAHPMGGTMLDGRGSGGRR